MKSWQLQEAKQRLSELLRAVESEGPQVITRHGREIAVVVDLDDFRRLGDDRREDFKDFLSNGPPLDDLQIERDSTPARPVEIE